MYSSQLASFTPRILGSVSSSSACVRTWYVSALPAPAMGLRMRGKPISSAAARTSFSVRTRRDRGTRNPAARTRSFMISLSRKPRTVSGLIPGKPQRSRRRAASITSTSQLASTRSMLFPFCQAETRSITSSSSRMRGTWR